MSNEVSAINQLIATAMPEDQLSEAVIPAKDACSKTIWCRQQELTSDDPDHILRRVSRPERLVPFKRRRRVSTSIHQNRTHSTNELGKRVLVT